MYLIRQEVTHFLLLHYPVTTVTKATTVTIGSFKDHNSRSHLCHNSYNRHNRLF